MDAVFFPKCVQDEMTFQQEGWHFELDDKEAPLTFKGVVFNEMKGVYSSPDSVLYRRGRNAACACNVGREGREGGREGESEASPSILLYSALPPSDHLPPPHPIPTTFSLHPPSLLHSS